MNVERIDAKAWEEHYAANARRACFSEILPQDFDRIDFALLVYDTRGPLGFITCRETDAESVYLKHGGAFPPAEKSVASLGAYRAALRVLREKYRRLTTLVENTNRSYLKMAIHEGFVPIGLRHFNGSTLVELFLKGDG